jgi:hypothetical protein
VSGGEDDKAFVWKLSDGKVQFTCNGNSHVTCKFLVNDEDNNISRKLLLHEHTMLACHMMKMVNKIC